MRPSNLVLFASALGQALASPQLARRQSSGRSSPLLTDFPGQGSLPTLADIINLNATNGTFLPLQNIQGDIFVGMKKPQELFYFFSIVNATLFKSVLKNRVAPLVTSAATLLSTPSNQPLAFLNIAFSQSGLTALGNTDNLGDTQFAGGMYADATSLGDVQTDYEPAFQGTSIHGVFLIGSDQSSYIDNLLSTINGYFGNSIAFKTQLSGAARPGSNAGHEHFGYLDGISQPAVGGFSIKALPGQSIVPTGIILTNRVGDTGSRPSSGWMLDGSFMVFRKLQQFVPEFNGYLNAHPVQNAAGNLTQAQGAELLGARMFGRWKSGAPLDLAPTADDPALGADPQRNNFFDYSHLGSLLPTDQSHCPFSAHVRKVRPRADLLDLNVQNQAIRGSIPYGPEVSAAEASAGTTSVDRGLAFVEYQSTIANGFRFQQVAWANTANFPPAKNQTVGLDAVIGQAGGGGPRTAVGLDPRDASRSFVLPQFLKAKGGEYFFVPSISALQNKIAA